MWLISVSLLQQLLTCVNDLRAHIYAVISLHHWLLVTLNSASDYQANRLTDLG